MRSLMIVLAVLLAVPAHGSEVLDNAAVVRMVSAGLGADIITLKIERSECAFDTSTDALIALKGAQVPDAVIRAMLMKGDGAAHVRASQPAPPPALSPPTIGEDVCANVKFYTTSNDGQSWVPSNVCAGAKGVSVDEQTIALAEVIVQCTSKPPVLAMGGSLLHGDQEWWIGDAKETLKFRGKPDDLDHLVTALKHARSEIPSGNCNDREVRKRLVRP